MSQFTVTGRFKSRNEYAAVESTIGAENEHVTREHVLSQLGSRHGLTRMQIELEVIQQ